MATRTLESFGIKKLRFGLFSTFCTLPTGEAVVVPTRHGIESVEVGDGQTDCFGNMSTVTEISFRGVSQHGRAYVGFYTKHGETGQMSMSISDGKLTRTVHLTGRLTSAECDELEAAVVAAREKYEAAKRAERGSELTPTVWEAS